MHYAVQPNTALHPTPATRLSLQGRLTCYAAVVGKKPLGFSWQDAVLGADLTCGLMVCAMPGHNQHRSNYTSYAVRALHRGQL